MSRYRVTYLQEVVHYIEAASVLQAGEQAKTYARTHGLNLTKVETPQPTPALTQEPASA